MGKRGAQTCNRKRALVFVGLIMRVTPPLEQEDGGQQRLTITTTT